MLEHESPTEAMNYAPEPWVLRRCIESGLVYLENPPDYESFVEDFAWDKTYRKTADERREAEPILYGLSNMVKRFRHRILKRNKVKSLTRSLIGEIGKRRVNDEIRLLDIGCGGGNLLLSVVKELDDPLRQRCVSFGIELSRELARIASEKFNKLQGGRCINDTALDGMIKFEKDYFDIIVMSSFLEHEINPLPLLHRCRNSLKPGGVILIKVPNFASINRLVRRRKWAGFRWPDHVNYFTPGTLRAMTEKAGFAVKRMKFFDRFPLSDSMYLVLQKSSVEMSGPTPAD